MAALRDRLTKPRFLLAYLFVGYFLVVARPSAHQMRLGVPLVLLGALLRVWANGYVGHVKVNNARVGYLVTGGPYAYVRNPLYLGSLLIGTGLLVIAGRVWFAVITLGCLTIAYRWKILEEEALLRQEAPEAYARYARLVPRCLPTRRRYPDPTGRWSWQGLMASKEPKTLAWVVVLVVALYFWEAYLQDRWVLFQKHGPLNVVLLSLMVVLMVSDGALELASRRARRPAAKESR